MPSWVETKTEIIHFSMNQNNSGNGNFFWNTNLEELNTELDRILRNNYDKHFQIVGCVPLTTGVAHHHAEWKFQSNSEGSYGGAGYGYGWGLSNISGAIVFLQKVEQLSQDEFDRRSVARRLADRISSLKSELEALKNNLSSVVSTKKLLAWSQSARIEELPGLKTRYQIGGETFFLKKKAERHLADSQASYQKSQQKENELLLRQTGLKDQLKRLESESIEQDV